MRSLRAAQKPIDDGGVAGVHRRLKGALADQSAAIEKQIDDGAMPFGASQLEGQARGEKRALAPSGLIETVILVASLKTKARLRAAGQSGGDVIRRGSGVQKKASHWRMVE